MSMYVHSFETCYAKCILIYDQNIYWLIFKNIFVQAAVGYDYEGKTEKHESQKGS